MLKTIRTIGALAAAVALLALPGTALAAPGGQGKGKNCETRSAGFQVSGTLVSVTADDPGTTGVSEATVTLTVTAANSHARKSEEVADQDATKKGVQVVGATYTVPAGEVFELKLNGFEAPDTPSAGDRVKVSGRIPVTKKRCAPAGTSTADRYDAPDVRRVTISDRDADV